MNPNYSQGNNDMEVGLKVATEWDELWPCVGSKADQRWTWYLINRTNGGIVAWENGRRTDGVFKKPLNSVKDIPIKICHADNWGACPKLFPKDYLHIIGKDNTWKTERENLNFRTHVKRLNRKTICFSEDEKTHDKAISMYIEKYYFQESVFNENTA